MFQIKIQPKEKIGLSIAAVIVVIAVGDRLVFTPVRDTFEQINRETIMAEKQLASRIHNINQKDLVAAEYQKYGLTLKETSSDDERTAKMLSEIEALAKKAGIALADIKPQPVRNIDVYREAAVVVNAQGSMEAVVMFLHYLHDSPLLLRTQKLHLDLKDNNSSAIQISIKVAKVLI